MHVVTKIDKWNRLNRKLEKREGELSVARLKLKTEIDKRKSAELSLRQSEKEGTRLLYQSNLLKERFRHLSRRILTTQEEERKRISRELHDLVAQTLAAINVHLATMKNAMAKNTHQLNKSIARTQKLVETSVDRVHRFALELRPAMLDDLGLTPALRALMENFSRDRGLHVKMVVSSKVELLSNDKRTALYRVAQEALNNIVRHANASNVMLQIKEEASVMCMSIHDDGRSFDLNRLFLDLKSRRMGLLGMRERVEMVGGRFLIASEVGQGTTVTARIPFVKRVAKEKVA